MKRLICIVLAMAVMIGCACAEEMSLWEHEAGWISFSIALSQDGLDEVWDEGAEKFGKSLGIPMMTGTMFKSMMLKGYAFENGVDEIHADRNRFSGRTQDGDAVFDHEYALAEVLEDANIMGGVRVHVFRTEEEAGAFTYLLLTEPVTVEQEGTHYTTFNMLHTEDEYMKLFEGGEPGEIQLPCTMVEKDTELSGIVLAIEKFVK